MRTLLTLALVASPALMAAGPGNTSSATAKTFVNIVAPVFVECTQDLYFGTVLMDAYDQGGSVTMTTETKPNVNPTVKTLTTVGCDQLLGGKISPAFFHYMKDNRYPVNVIVEGKTMAGSGLVGVAVPMGLGVSLNPSTDLPADACGIFNPLPNQVDAYHFGVGGELTIAKNTFGEKQGTIHVTVAYK